MRICLFSDIHGNGPAFIAAAKMIANEAADINLFLGDLCGYYFDQIEIFDALFSLPNLIALRGNHDQMLLDIINGDKAIRMTYRKKYGSSIDHMLESGADAISTWISSLPQSFTDEHLSLYACHGSPENLLDGYVYPDSPLDHLSVVPQKLILLGHTHYPMKRNFEDKTIINPGSLGQPRNRNWPSYAVITIPEMSITFQKVHYNKQTLLNRLEEVGETTPYLRQAILRT